MLDKRVKDRVIELALAQILSKINLNSPSRRRSNYALIIIITKSSVKHGLFIHSFML